MSDGDIPDQNQSSLPAQPASEDKTHAPQSDQTANQNASQADQPRQPDQPASADMSMQPSAGEASMDQVNAATNRMQQATPTDRAVNIIEAAAFQRQAISEAYQKQKAAMEEAVTAQKAAALHQLAMARHTQAQSEADSAISDARSATNMLRSVLGKDPEEDDGGDGLSNNDKRLIAALAQLENERRAQALRPQNIATAGMPNMPGMSRMPTASAQGFQNPQARGQGQQQPGQQTSAQQGSSGNPVIDELLVAIRTIISQEVTSQLTRALERMISDSTQQDKAENTKNTKTTK